MTCNCVSCGECGGSGFVWRSFDGEYLGDHRCDDLDEMEDCPQCEGEGISELCDECQQALEDSREDW